MLWGQYGVGGAVINLLIDLVLLDKGLITGIPIARSRGLHLASG